MNGVINQFSYTSKMPVLVRLLEKLTSQKLAREFMLANEFT